MSKIAIDARSRGSTGRYADRLIKYLQQLDKDNEYNIIVKSKQNWTPKANNFSKTISDVDDYTFKEQFDLLLKLRKINPDLVHFTMPQQPVLYRGRVVTTIHDLTMLRFHNINGNRLIYYVKLLIFRAMLFYVARKSAAIIVPTKFVKRDVVKTLKVDPKKVHITYESVDSIGTRAEPVEGLANKSFILFSGNVFPHKNVPRLIEAFKILRLKYPDLHLVVAGKLNQNAKKLKQEAEKTMDGYVHFLGFVPDNQLRWLLENAKVYVYPSLSEGFGLPGLEAMRYKTPLVSSNATCLPEVYGNAANYFDPYDSVDIARAVDEILSSSKRKEELIAAGQKQLKKYSWRKMAGETLEIYRSVLSEG